MLSTAADVDILPAIPAQVLSPVHSTHPLPTPVNTSSIELSQSASFTNLSDSIIDVPVQGIKRTFSENALALSNHNRKPSQSSNTSNKELFRKASKNAKNRISVARFTLSAEDVNRTSTVDGVLRTEHVERAKALSRSVTGTIRSLARKSWISSSSKSQSPPRKDTSRQEKKRSRLQTQVLKPQTTETIAIPAPVASRPSSRSSKRDEDDTQYPELTRSPRQAPPMAPSTPDFVCDVTEVDTSSGTPTISRTPTLSRTPSMVSMRSKSSRERLYGKIPFIKVPPIPKSISSDRLSTASSESIKKKDPLWGAFRSLEAEYVK
jgi:hypothetical protein